MILGKTRETDETLMNKSHGNENLSAKKSAALDSACILMAAD